MPHPHPLPHSPGNLKTTASCGVLCAAVIPTRICGHVIQYVHTNKMKTHMYAFVHGQILQLQKLCEKKLEYLQYSLNVSLKGCKKEGDLNGKEEERN